MNLSVTQRNRKNFNEKVGNYLKQFTPGKQELPEAGGQWFVKTKQGLLAVKPVDHEDDNLYCLRLQFVNPIVKNDTTTFTSPGASLSAPMRLGPDVYVDIVLDQFAIFLRKWEPITFLRLDGMIADDQLDFDSDDEGCMINSEGRYFYCNLSGCDTVAKHRVVVSVNKPHDETRNLCDTCYASYTIGVQHGRAHEARLHNVKVGCDNSQSIQAFKEVTCQ